MNIKPDDSSIISAEVAQSIQVNANEPTQAGISMMVSKNEMDYEIIITEAELIKMLEAIQGCPQ